LYSCDTVNAWRVVGDGGADSLCLRAVCVCVCECLCVFV
jgi:hypothetical protein